MTCQVGRRGRWLKLTAPVLLSLLLALVVWGINSGDRATEIASPPATPSASPSSSATPAPVPQPSPNPALTPSPRPTPEPTPPEELRPVLAQCEVSHLTAADWGPSLAQWRQAEQAVADMSVAEQAGYVLLPQWNGSSGKSARLAVSEVGASGLILMGGNITSPQQVRDLTAAVQQHQQDMGRDWSAIISVDEEGGRVSRLAGIIPSLDTFRSYGDLDEPLRTETDFKVLGASMADLGVTMNFAPVADVSFGPADTTIGDRSAGNDPLLVSRTVVAAASGLQDAGIIPVLKHFPGHGSVAEDSHVTLPRQDATVTQLRESDWVGFLDAVAQGAPVVMMGHILVPDIDPENVSSLSPATYDLLRTELGFAGLIVTDALNMSAVTAGRTPQEVAVQALGAGADLLLMPVDPPATRDGIVAAVETGDLSADRLSCAATRITALQIYQRDLGTA